MKLNTKLLLKSLKTQKAQNEAEIIECELKMSRLNEFNKTINVEITKIIQQE